MSGVEGVWDALVCGLMVRWAWTAGWMGGWVGKYGKICAAMPGVLRRMKMFSQIVIEADQIDQHRYIWRPRKYEGDVVGVFGMHSCIFTDF